VLGTAKAHIDWLTLMKISAALLASLMLVAGTWASTSSPANTPLVKFEDGRISVKAGDVPLKDILSEIQHQSGIVIELKDSKAAEKRAFVDFKNLLPALAFREILQDLNFAFFYSGTRLARVLILSSGDQIPESRSGFKKPNRSPRQFPPARNAPLDSKVKPKLPGKTSQGSHVTSKLDAIEAMEDSDDPKTIAALGDALADQDREVKEAALQVLADKKGANVTQMLRRGLSDADPEFRIEVLEALADRGDQDSLRKALADRNQDVRETAADLLESATPQK
jgi:hypothetical protein